MADSVSRKKKAPIVAEDSCQSKGKRSSELSVYKSSAEVTVRKKSSKSSSVYKGSNEYFEYCCDPCSTDGAHVEAHGFCTECKEYLCGTCYKSHSRSKLSRHHILLDKDNMPRKAYKTCDPCKSAGEKADAAGYCTDCKEYLCENCFRSHSRSKLSKHHVLLDKVGMHMMPKSNLVSSVARMNICEGSDDNFICSEDYTHVRDINVTAAGDEHNCYIADMTLVTDTKLVLADGINQCLKLIEIEKSAVIYVLGLDSEPYGITTVSQDQVAVALPYLCQIKLISLTGGLSVSRTMKTTGMCLDVLCMKDKIYVSCQSPVKFDIFRLTGSVYKTIKPNSKILKHCTNPRHITVSPDERLIFVSDSKNNKIISLNMDGNLVCQYPDQLDKPEDVTISPFGTVYLCNKRLHVVYKMPLNLSEAIVVLGEGDGLEFPMAMCFNPGKQHIYVSSGSTDVKFRNFIKVFEWK